MSIENRLSKLEKAFEKDQLFNNPPAIQVKVVNTDKTIERIIEFFPEIPNKPIRENVLIYDRKRDGGLPYHLVGIE